MIHIKCVECGSRIPFKSKQGRSAMRNRELGNIVCPNCGRILIFQDKKRNKYLP